MEKILIILLLFANFIPIQSKYHGFHLGAQEVMHIYTILPVCDLGGFYRL